MRDTTMSDADIGAIKKMLEDWTACLVDQDWTRWQSFWAEDGVLMPPDGARVVGRADLVPFVSGVLKNIKSFAFSDWTFDGIDDLAVVTNTIRIETEGGGQPPTAMRDDQMLLLRRHEDGNWRVHRVIFNGSGPE